MTRMLVAYFVALVVFTGIDMIWLGFVASGFYRQQMGDLMAEKISLPPAIAFYLIFAVGLVVFGAMSGLRDNSLRSAFLYSALLGLCAYATYDLTNLAVVKGWPTPLSLVDLAWGTVLAGIAGACSYLAANAIG